MEEIVVLSFPIYTFIIYGFLKSFSNKYLMWSKFQYVGVVSIIILKEDFLQLCLKIAGLETKCLWMSRLGSRDKQTQKSDLSD